MAFHEVQLPPAIEVGARGGPQFKTIIKPLTSGFERRNIDWAAVLGSWDIGYAIRTQVNLDIVRDFFYAREGRAHGFLFKDWTDFKIGVLGSEPDSQTIGTGDASKVAFQIFKRYTSGGINYDRDIKKPIAGLNIYIDTVLQTITTDYTEDLTTGIITMVTAPAGGEDLTINCEFNVAVRFDVDKLDVTAMMFDDTATARGLLARIPRIPIQGIRTP